MTGSLQPRLWLILTYKSYICDLFRFDYLYLAIDKYGNTVDFMLSKQRDEAAAKAFFQQAIEDNGLPEKVVIDKSGANNV